MLYERASTAPCERTRNLITAITALFIGLKRVAGSEARAVCIFMEEATERINLMNRIYVNIS